MRIRESKRNPAVDTGHRLIEDADREISSPCEPRHSRALHHERFGVPASSPIVFERST